MNMGIKKALFNKKITLAPHSPKGGLALIIAFCIAALAALSNAPAYSEEQKATTAPQKINIILFWGDGCPHCEKEWEFLNSIKSRYPEIVIRDFEVWNNRQNAIAFQQFADSIGMKQRAVPVTIIANTVYNGFSEQAKLQMESKIAQLSKEARSGAKPGSQSPLSQTPREPDDKKVLIPLLGPTDISKYSLPVFTIILGGLDSFNPCAMYVLLFLLSLLIHAKNRAKMLLIGGTFVFFSGFVYFLFMAAWLNVFIFTGRVAVITIMAGAVALVIGGINVKDFFAFKRGVSLTISDEAKPKLMDKMRGLLKADSMATMMAGAVALAVFANMYELLCTAGFPMVFTRILTMNKLPQTQYYMYLAFYNVVYVIPLAVIVAVFTLTMGSRKLTETEGRRLKLLSGLMMLLLGLVLLIKPALLNNVLTAAGLLLAAVAATVIISYLKRED